MSYDPRMDPTMISLSAQIMDELFAAERAFAATVQAGDRVTWEEWVWEAGITGNPADPATSKRVTFTGVVQRVARDEQDGVLYVDPATVTPTAAEVRQRPRCRLPINAFDPAPSPAAARKE